MNDFLIILTNLIHNTIVYSTPLILAALGGVYSERSGVVNIALEGFMIMGAFTSAVVTIFLSDYLGAFSPYFSLLIVVFVGMLFALLHAVASVSYKADQVVSGVAINFLAAGISIFLVTQFFNGAKQTTTIKFLLSKWQIPYLSDIPYLGKAFFSEYPTSYLAFFLVLLSYIVIYKTPFGLRLRAVGEHPHAVDTLGISVKKMRYIAVIISGGLAALGGATVTLTTSANFSHNTISGQGFIAIAAMIFGKWHPVGAMFAALFFGLTQAIKSLSQVLGLEDILSVDLINMLPYLVTIIVLAIVGKTTAPKAIGKPYEIGER